MSTDVIVYDDLSTEQKISLIYALLICNSVKLPTNKEHVEAMAVKMKNKLLAKKALLGQDISSQLGKVPSLGPASENTATAALTNAPNANVDMSNNPSLSSNITFWSTKFDNEDNQNSTVSIDNSKIQSKLTELKDIDITSMVDNQDDLVDFQLAKSKLEAYFKSKLNV